MDIKLIELGLKHAKDLYEVRQDPELTKFLTRDYHSTLEKTKEFIKSTIEKKNSGKSYYFGIKLNNKIVGLTHIFNINIKNKNADVGTWLSRDYWGKGINQKSKLLLFDFAFNRLKLNRLSFHIAKENIRAQKALEKIQSIQKEGILREARFFNGKFRDMVVYSILKRDFENEKHN